MTWAGFLCVFFAVTCSAGTVRTLDGKSYDGPASINASGKILIDPANAAPAQVALDDVLDTMLGAAKAPAPALDKGVVFIDGSALAVERFDAIDDTTVKYTRGGKQATTDLSQVARLIFQKVPEAQWAKVPAGHAGAVLANGDFFEGDFKGLGAGLIRVNSVLFGPSEFVPGRQAAAVVLADVRPGESQWIVGLNDGSLFLAKSIRAEGDRLKIDAPPAESTAVPVASVASIKVGAARIRPLDTKSAQSAGGAAILEDATTAGVPMALTGTTVLRGIGMPAGASATFDLPPGCRAFVCRAGVPAGVVPAAKVRFVVLLDGREAFRSAERTSTDDALEISLPTRGIRRLTLKVESADEADTGASGLWGDASLLKGLPQ